VKVYIQIVTVPIEEWSITSEYVAGTNVLGLVFYSLLIGLAIGKIDRRGKPLSDFFNYEMGHTVCCCTL